MFQIFYMGKYEDEIHLIQKPPGPYQATQFNLRKVIILMKSF